MDRESGTPKKRWDWLPEQMPGVVALLAERRKEFGDEWINECWKRGVLRGEPGWFFAGEGGLMVGTLWDDPVIAAFASARLTRTQAVVVVKAKGTGDGAN